MYYPILFLCTLAICPFIYCLQFPVPLSTIFYADSEELELRKLSTGSYRTQTMMTMLWPASSSLTTSTLGATAAISCAKAHLAYIPEDIFLLVIQTLAVWDILSLKQVQFLEPLTLSLADGIEQTCRKLHEVCSLASVWYHFYKHLPLESKWSDVDLSSMASSSWQSIVLRAIKTDHNWKRPSPQLRGLRKISSGSENGIASHVRSFNRGNALLWISYPRDRPQDYHSLIKIWDISCIDAPQLRWKFNSLGFGSFFDLYEGDGKVVFAYGRDIDRVQG